MFQIINAGNRRVNQAGILKKWQLIFYGTSTNPIRLRSQSQGFSFPGQDTFARRVVAQPQYFTDYNGGNYRYNILFYYIQLTTKTLFYY